MPIKILHLMTDEKFINFTINLFDKNTDITNIYLVRLSGDLTKPKFVLPGGHVIFISDDFEEFEKSLARIGVVDSLIVHFLDLNSARFVSLMPDHIPVLWSGWGKDYYRLFPGGEFSFCSDATKKLWFGMFLSNDLNETENFYSRIVRYRNALVNRFLNFKESRILNSAVYRVNYFSSPLADEYELVKHALGPQFKAEYAQINYGSVEESFDLGRPKVDGENILLGNSAFPTNNHVDLFERLSHVDMRGRKIIVPLSYGHMRYRDQIIELGRKMFGDAFLPLSDFMPIEEYNNLISGCGVTIMGHKRQQGLGNTCAQLFRGAKVFLDEESSTYSFLKRNGAFVFGLNEIDSKNFTPLTSDEIEVNKSILNKFWGESVVEANVAGFVKLLTRT